MADWLHERELRLGLGCMRLSTDPEVGVDRLLATVAAAAAAGITVFDTAHAYSSPEGPPGENERLVGRALRAAGAAGQARIVTKGGMTRLGGRWVPDGRARTLLEIDLYLVHAPDPRTPWATSVRALRRLLDEKLVRRIGVSNVNRAQLEQALDIAPLSAIEVPLSLLDDRALRGGLLDLCSARGLALIAYSPLGGPRRKGALARSEAVRAVADEVGASPEEIALAWLCGLAAAVVPIPGARRPDGAISAAQAAEIRLEERHRAGLAEAFGIAGSRQAPPPRRPARPAEVVLLMGIPGAGKTRLAGDLVARGFLRLNRDERGGTLAEVAADLEARLEAGVPRLVLDNTYLTRASRSRVLEVAARHGATVRCIWLATPLEEAQVNMVERLLDRFGRLPSAEQLRTLARREPGLHSPISQLRAARELERPSLEEGFGAVEERAFERRPPPDCPAGAVFVAAAALGRPALAAAISKLSPGRPHLLFDWRPQGAAEVLALERAQLAALVAGPVEAALCHHPAGPPACWCRPPLPGLLLEFARVHAADPARSVLIGTTTTHRRLAQAVGAGYAEV